MDGTPHDPYSWSMHGLFLRVLGARGHGFSNQCIHIRCTLGSAVKLKMQRGHGMNMQTLEQAIAQETRRARERRLRFFRIAREQAVMHGGMRVIRCDLHRIDRDHTHMRIFQLARDELRQITLDLVSHADTAIGGGAFFLWHGLKRTSHFFDLKEFQHVAFNDVVVALDVQAALEAFFDFLGIIFEALERFEFAREDDHVVAQEAQAR
jgi:hypothetical protein